MNVKVPITFLSILCAAAISAQNSLSGICRGTDGVGLSDVNVVLCDSNTVYLRGAITSADGRFSFEDIAQGSYILRCSMVGYITANRTVWCDGDKESRIGITLHEDSRQLDELVVLPEQIKSYAGRDEILLTQEQLKAGNNAVDVLSLLPNLTKNIDGTLAAMDGGGMLILINGRKASQADLRVQDPGDILKVIHYTQPPARYAGQGYTNVLDVRLKKNNRRKIGSYISANHAATYLEGQDYLNFNYEDSLNRLSLSYSLYYANYNHGEVEGIFGYRINDTLWQQNRYATSNSQNHSMYHNITADYSYDNGRDLFAFKGGSSFSPYSRISMCQDAEIRMGDKVYTGIMESARNSEDNTWWADLYYQRTFSGESRLELDVVGTYATVKSGSRLDRNVDGLGHNSFFDYTNEEKYSNETYSVIAEAVYSGSLWGGDASAGTKFMYKNLFQNNKFHDNTNMDIITEYAYLYYGRSWEKFSFNVNAGVQNNTFRLSDGTYNFTVPVHSLYMNYNFSKTASIQFNSHMKASVPSSGALSNNTSLLDERYWITGNPSLKVGYNYTVALQSKIKGGNNTLFFQPNISYVYSHNPISSVIVNGGSGIFYRKNINLSTPAHTVNWNATLSWQPTKWFLLKAFYHGDYSEYSTPSQNINHISHMINLTARLSWWQMYLDLSCRNVLADVLGFTTVTGDFYMPSIPSYMAQLYWAHGERMAGLTWSYRDGTYNPSVNVADMYNSSVTSFAEMRNKITIFLSYRFSHGNVRHKKADRNINNRDNDKGLLN